MTSYTRLPLHASTGSLAGCSKAQVQPSLLLVGIYSTVAHTAIDGTTRRPNVYSEPNNWSQTSPMLKRLTHVQEGEQKTYVKLNVKQVTDSCGGPTTHPLFRIFRACRRACFRP